MGAITLRPGRLSGVVTPPLSKSHLHRLLIANFLAGDRSSLEKSEEDCEDILATKRCLKALSKPEYDCVLDCGESASTLRFLEPIAAALGKRAHFIGSERLLSRPRLEYRELKSGLHELPGDVSSQFVSALLFALPLLDGDSEIKFSSPLQSQGYVDLTRQVLTKAGIKLEGFRVPGNQRYQTQALAVERDWSGAAFWYGANALGSEITIEGMNLTSLQPDRAIVELVCDLPDEIEVSGYPDLFPILTVVAAGKARKTIFTGVSRLRFKESDRVKAMAENLRRMGVAVETADDSFSVVGTAGRFVGGSFNAGGDHRVAMALAIASTRGKADFEIIGAECVRKSYPHFFETFKAGVGPGPTHLKSLPYPDLFLRLF